MHRTAPPRRPNRHPSCPSPLQDHPTAGVFDVDCTAAGQPLCEANGVKGYPTIKYGDPEDLQDYEGGPWVHRRRRAEAVLRPGGRAVT